MKKLILVAVFATMLLPPAGAQQQPIDSLLQVLSTLKEDTNRVKLLRDISFQYVNVDPEQARSYSDSALALSEALDFQWGIYSSLYTKAVIEYYTGDNGQAIALAQQALKYLNSANDPASKIKVLNFLSSIHQQQNLTERALEYANAALQLGEQIQDQESVATALYNIGQLQQNIGNVDIAKANFLKALAIFEQLGLKSDIATVCQGMTIVTKGEEALGYANRALAIFEEIGDVRGKAFCLSSMGTIYYESGENEEALNAYQQSLSLCRQLNFAYGVASLSSNIGLLLTEMNRFEEAYGYLMESQSLAKALDALDILTTAYRGLANYYAQQRQPARVQETVDSLLALQDTLYSREKADLLIQAETKYQLKEKESQMAYEVGRQKRLRNIFLLSALAALLGLAALFQYFRNRQKLQRKEAELALQLEKAEAEQLRELDQLKSNFFANISHEFRTPLTLILGPLQQMRQGTFQGNRQQYFDIMHRNAGRLQALINQLLDLSKLESRRMQLNPESGDIFRFIRQLANAMESWAARKQIDYQLQVPEQALWVAFDRDKLEKILVNLLSNALKFTPNGGKVNLEVQAQSTNQQEKLLLKVADSGKGIAAAEMDKIFQRFYHSTATPDGTASSGIGLALTKELVELHGGSIQVESEEGKGTTFIIELPFEKAAAVETEAPISEAEAITPPALTTAVPVSEAAAAKDAPIVLIVEDNPDVRAYIKDQLAGRYRLLEAENGIKGLEMAREAIPDLIITDVMMPEMDGTALTYELKTDERTSHIPVVMLTAKAERSDKLEGLETGADDYLIKPFDAQELQARIKNLIEQRRRLRERFTRDSLLSPKDIAVTSVDERFLARVMETIEEHIDNESFSIESLAREVGMSRSQLHRKVTALTDRTPTALLRTIRLQRARQLLEQKAGNTTEVAFMVGFSSLAYFSKCFKDEFGVTPSEVGK